MFTIHAQARTNTAPPRYAYHKANWTKFATTLHANLQIRRFNSPEEIDEGVIAFTRAVQHAADTAIPKFTPVRQPDALPPDILQLKRTMNAAKRRWTRYRRLPDRHVYNLLRANLRADTRQWCQAKWAQKLKQASNHTDIWKLSKSLKRQPQAIPPLTSPAGTALSDEDKATALSLYFEAAHKQTENLANPTHTELVTARRVPA